MKLLWILLIIFEISLLATCYKVAVIEYSPLAKIECESATQYMKRNLQQYKYWIGKAKLEVRVPQMRMLLLIALINTHIFRLGSL